MNKYLESFTFLTLEKEEDFCFKKANSDSGDTLDFNTVSSKYPFRTLSSHGLFKIEFEPVTILFGDNGCGKSTVINLIAAKLEAKRKAEGNSSVLFFDYLRLCEFKMFNKPESISCISSDSIFEKILAVRNENDEIRNKRAYAKEEYDEGRYNSSDFRPQSLDDFEKLKRINQARSLTKREFIRRSLLDPVETYSNGETALNYFTEEIKDNGLYLLDEPENSLSPSNQIQLADFLFSQARFYHCQFVIATHSPFLLAIPSAKIYEIGEKETKVKKWTELDGVRTYFDFFMSHEKDFK